MFTIREIMDLLPHRYPFLLVDRVVEYDPGVRIVGLKNVTIIAHKGPVWKMHGEARVGGALAAEADLTATISEAFAEPVREGAGK